ncbi:unnamed protein product [Closterium sp. NIES-53]
MALRPSSVPQRIALPSRLASSLPDVSNLEFDLARAASPTVTRLPATVVTDPDFESTAAFALVTELVDFAARRCLDYIASLNFLSSCLAAALPRFASMLLCPEGDPDAPEIPTPRSYAKAIADEYSSYWQIAMDAEMASWKSTGTYGSLHEEIWLHCPPGFTGSFPAGTQWSFRRPVYGLHQAPREWHDTLRTTLAAIGFAPSSADPSVFLRTDTSRPPFYVLVYIDDLVFATADTEALALVKAEL